MEQNDSYQIEAEAAKALAQWKSLFAEQVALTAKALAVKEATSVITLDHYCEAASTAMQMLATAVQDIDPSDGRRKAA